jgi:hypothetical protein
MIPVVNTGVKMPMDMFKALCRLETTCAVTERREMAEDDVRQWLETNFNKKLADSFRPEFLFNTPTA